MLTFVLFNTVGYVCGRRWTRVYVVLATCVPSGDNSTGPLQNLCRWRICDVWYTGASGSRPRCLFQSIEFSANEDHRWVRPAHFGLPDRPKIFWKRAAGCRHIWRPLAITNSKRAVSPFLSLIVFIKIFNFINIRSFLLLAIRVALVARIVPAIRCQWNWWPSVPVHPALAPPWKWWTSAQRISRMTSYV